MKNIYHLYQKGETAFLVRGGPFLCTGFTILSRKAFLGPHPPTFKSFRKAVHKPVHQEIQDSIESVVIYT